MADMIKEDKIEVIFKGENSVSIKLNGLSFNYLYKALYGLHRVLINDGFSEGSNHLNSAKIVTSDLITQMMENIRNLEKKISKEQDKSVS